LTSRSRNNKQTRTAHDVSK